MSLSSELLSSAVRRVQDYSVASEQIAPLKEQICAEVWAYLAHVRWECGQSKPTHDDRRDWHDRTKAVAQRQRAQGFYGDACLGIQVVIAEWMDRHQESEPPFSSTTEYAMARGVAWCHEHRWLTTGGFAAYGGVNPPDMIALLESEGGFWNIYLRHKAVERANEAVQAAVGEVKKIAGYLGTVSGIVARHKSVIPLETQMKRCLQFASSLSDLAKQAADSAGTAVLNREAKEQADTAERYHRDAAKQANDAEDHLVAAIKIGETEPPDVAETPPTTGETPTPPTGETPTPPTGETPTPPTGETPTPTGETPTPPTGETPTPPTGETDDDDDETPIPPTGRVYIWRGPQSNESANDDELWKDVAFQNRLRDFSTAGVLATLLERLGVSPIPPSGSVKWEHDGTKFTSIEFVL